MKTKNILLLFLVAYLSGCHPDLDLAPLNQITTSTFYKTEADARSALNAVYASLQNMYGFEYNTETILTPTAVGADEAIPFLQGNANRQALWRFTFVPENAWTNGAWALSYQAIQRANVVIERVPGIEMDANLRARFVAEAKFLRAFHYFNLVRFFGGVPIVDKETTTLNGLQAPRASVDQVYDFIIKDLQEIEEVLPMRYPTNEIGRATRGAAKGLLAKAYLTRAGSNSGSQFWAMAASKAKEVMDLGIYDLYDQYEDAFKIEARGQLENVFEITFVKDVFGQSHSTYWAPRGAPIVPFNGFGTARVSKSLWDSFSPEDKRRAGSFLTSYVHNGQTVDLSIDTPDPSRAISFWKFADLTSNVFSGGARSFPYMRYAEILLIYAEALNESGGPSLAAYEGLNRVRQRARLTPLSNLTQPQFKEAVLLERKLELNFEGHRWFDLVRTGRLVAAVQAESSFGRNPAIGPHHVLFPIPQREIDINKALNQNPGY
jgi:starch-binding outer membrane protein, SusD/RagB family